MIVRIVGNNLGGGARKHCFLLNRHLMSIGREIKTFIPRAPIRDIFSDRESVEMDYVNTRNWLSVILFLLKRRGSIDYVHLHLRNVCIVFSPILILLKLPYVVTIHTTMPDVVGIKEVFLRKMYRYALTYAKENIFISEYIRSVILRDLDLNLINGVVVPNGSEEAAFIRNHNKSGRLSICVVGELTERKGIKDLPYIMNGLELKIFREIVFNIYGDGPLRNVLTQYANNNDANRRVKVFLHGYVGEISDIYGENDINIILSKNEAFGRVVTEAMAYGVPTIAQNFGAFPEIINSGVDGFLCDGLPEIIEKIIELEKDRDALVSLGKAARIKYVKCFTDEIFLKNTMRILNDF